MAQADVSRTESREDHRLSTLRRYVEALGGELESAPWSTAAACAWSAFSLRWQP